MRITNNYMTRNYLNNLNNSLSLYNESANKLTTGRKISKMSDDVSAGTRALSVRTQSYKNEQIQDNVKKAGESLDVAEGNLTSIKDILQSVNEQTMTALNGTNISASNIFSINFTALKNQVIEFANCRYNNSYVLGGTNNTSAPFTVENGDLMYNGVRVNDIEKTEGKFYSDGTEVPFSESTYIDIGIGMSVKNGVVDPRSAFNMSVSGLDCLGYGTSEITYEDIDGNEHTMTVPNNAYDILDEMSKCLDEKDYDKLGALNDHLKETLNGLIDEIADIGVRTNYLDVHYERLEEEEYVLTEIQNNLEYIKDTDELINNKNLEYSWLLTLQYGGKILPQSLMDYVQ
ncbi:flagellin N-terminal helical domain-containing protein [Porcipelethomonas sp.]|uniref:flagellin N-terminal helical domain-containing protein n=1 Tax=Porcipelethomonas sp. TaxID=2981675 RepID=UPI003EF97A4F